MRRFTILTAIFLAALILRLALLYIDYSWDVNNHMSWAEDLIKYGFHQEFFSTISTHVFGSKYPNYPPLSLYLFYFIYPIQGFIYGIVWWANISIPIFPSKLIFFIESKTFLAGFYKLPSIITDFGIVWVLYLFAKKLFKTSSRKLLIFISIAFLFNPIGFYNSAFWGQIDGLNLFFALAAIYLAVFTKQTIPSMVLLVVSLLIKPNTIIFIPVYAFILYKRHSFQQILAGAFISFIVFYLAYLPFNNNPFNIFTPVILYWEKAIQAQSLAQVSNSALNFWTFVLPNAGISDQTAIFGILNYRILGYILFGCCLAGIAYFLLKDKNFNRGILYALFFSSLGSFLFLTKMHERYVLFFLPFLILIIIQNRKLLPVFLILTITGFLNMYNNWPVPRIEILKKLLENVYTSKFLSIVTLICFFFLLIMYYKEIKVLKKK